MYIWNTACEFTPFPSRFRAFTFLGRNWDVLELKTGRIIWTLMWGTVWVWTLSVWLVPADYSTEVKTDEACVRWVWAVGPDVNRRANFWPCGWVDMPGTPCTVKRKDHLHMWTWYPSPRSSDATLQWGEEFIVEDDVSVAFIGYCEGPLHWENKDVSPDPCWSLIKAGGWQ